MGERGENPSKLGDERKIIFFLHGIPKEYWRKVFEKRRTIQKIRWNRVEKAKSRHFLSTLRGEKNVISRREEIGFSVLYLVPAASDEISVTRSSTPG